MSLRRWQKLIAARTRKAVVPASLERREGRAVVDTLSLLYDLRRLNPALEAEGRATRWKETRGRYDTQAYIGSLKIHIVGLVLGSEVL